MDRTEKITFIRLPAVMARTGLSRSTIYQKIQQGCFPAPVKLGPRASAWIESEIERWGAELVTKSRAQEEAIHSR
jgi:prophage regulatory protein